MKKYRALFVTGLALTYAIAAFVFPDVLLPSEDQIVSIFDAIADVVSTGAPE